MSHYDDYRRGRAGDAPGGAARASGTADVVDYSDPASYMYYIFLVVWEYHRGRSGVIAHAPTPTKSSWVAVPRAQAATTTAT